jgi:YidC/Oxa1 family membrane protein insertase
MEEDKRNLILFFVISILIMVGYPHFFGNQNNIADVANISANVAPARSVTDDQIPARHAQNNKRNVAASNNALKAKSITLESTNLKGVISSCGVKIDNIFLKKYKQNLDEKSENVYLFGDKKNEYYADVYWASDEPNLNLPDENTVWETSSTTLLENSPITLTWDNGDGLKFKRIISVDENFVISIEDEVSNYGDRPITLTSLSRINRKFKKDDSSTLVSYEGPLGYLSGKLEEVSYEDIAKKQEIKHKTNGGWFGITDKYWLVAFIPDQKTNYSVSFKNLTRGNDSIYRIESAGEATILAPAATISHKYSLFVGAKEIKTLDMYERKLNVKHFDLALDFGWLYIITKPLLYSLAFTKDIVGNMGLVILLLTLIIKLLLLPLANKSYRSMNRLKEIQPKIQELQKKYADDKIKLGQEVSAIYKKEGVSPLGGCLPMLVQSPVLFALYKVLYISIEMRHAPFILWIHDLSLPDQLYIFNLFGMIPIDLPGFLQIGIWPILMGLSMLLQQKMGPAPADPAQANMMLIMPLMFTFMFAQLPSGLVIYWTFSNVLSIMQQYLITKNEEKVMAKNKKSKSNTHDDNKKSV